MTLNFSIAEAIEFAGNRLVSGDGGRLEAERLLAYLLKVERSYLYAWSDRRLTPTQWVSFQRLLQRRAKGEPLAYIRGWQEFWSLNLQVTEATLIPRPETEQVVELALQRLDLERALNVADLGTGSGAIALAMGSERPRARVIATDVSAETLEVARENGRRLGLCNVTFRLGDWFVPLVGERFHLIASNPPYIAEGDPHLTQNGLAFEPDIALIAKDKGLGAARHIAMTAREHLLDGGWLLLEHGYEQGPSLLALFTQLGYQQVADFCDLAGLPRVVAGQWRAC
ncbi:[protein release factor]-glutamine N5-methyltransferase [Nitrosococcus oceani ATCC 19707]|uniref:Release factor glutamine methyltransferase n=2 Tax=Nitrosococcus oceani TaxID=1229 RepID=Q3JE27_NITOC|nr:peptide chain release factor N(5)-glutamine methyltransferase [Nitrosococcus oceani]ABA56919.1 [protein release factor]-glutamine N5-methyltransferase [Nitrosococcus oceani ATCC 19707]EDZ66549.1 methyltransferase, HemK family [Nitrosococcus oceani AFC27]KFI20639.1 SAM-dependent methyltransferase [Nitrosococcus oceani C-27]